jgi:hypothetical protein
MKAFPAAHVHRISASTLPAVALMVVAACGFLLPVASAAAAQNQAPATTPAPGSSPPSAAADKQAAATAAPGHGLHSVTVTFDYNFTLTPACAEKLRERCILRFVAYDISAGVAHRAKLFEIPVPDGAKGQMHGITATSPKLDFESGKHLLAVTAQGPAGVESEHQAASVWVVIP